MTVFKYDLWIVVCAPRFRRETPHAARRFLICGVCCGCVTLHFLILCSIHVSRTPLHSKQHRCHPISNFLLRVGDRDRVRELCHETRHTWPTAYLANVSQWMQLANRCVIQWRIGGSAPGSSTPCTMYIVRVCIYM